MVPRHLVAWAISGSSVIGTAALTVVSVMAPAPPQQGHPASPSGPPVTVYDDRYIDDVVSPPPAPSAVEAEVSGGLTSVPEPAAFPESATAAWFALAAAVAPSAPEPTTQAPLWTDPPADPESAAPPAPLGAPGAPSTEPTPTTPGTAPPTTQQPTSMQSGLPPGAEVPSDWPVGTPYPPIPPGCRKPHLEDDGRWNCEH